MTKEQQIAHWMPIVNAVMVAEAHLPAEELERLNASRGTGHSMEQRAIEAYIRAVATEIVEHGGMEFVDDDEPEETREIEPYNEF